MSTCQSVSSINIPTQFISPTYPTNTRVIRTSSIAKWDKKRETCRNCKHIYLKTTSQYFGYCCVDCKSNAMYLVTINKSIRAVQQHLQNEERKEKQNEDQFVQDTKPIEEKIIVQEQKQSIILENKSLKGSECIQLSTTVKQDFTTTFIVKEKALSFAEFEFEERYLANNNDINWAFSAMY